jgi:hypothetical protein
MTDRDVKPANVLPWVAGPGQKLPPAPPLWALWSGTGHLLALATSTAEQPLDGRALLATGWEQVVDPEGRSK